MSQPPHRHDTIRLVSRGRRLMPVTLGRRATWLGDTYARLLSASWAVLLGVAVLLYLLVNLIFAGCYLAIGDGIENAHPGSFLDAYFFSVQTMATIGYGKMIPVGIMANILVTAEALAGFLYFAVVTGLVFSKFSRPTARVLFSKVAVICPYNGKPHLMLRLANERANRIVDARVHLVLFKTVTTTEGQQMRRFHDMRLLRERVPFIQLTWTVMHPIDEESPLFGMSIEELCAAEGEVIVSITGIDETLSQTIHARYSYIGEEVIYGATYEDVLRRRDDGRVEVNYHKFHNVNKAVNGS